MSATVEVDGAGLLCFEVAPAVEGVSWETCRGFPFKVLLDYPFQLPDIEDLKHRFPIVEFAMNPSRSNPSYYFADGVHPSPGLIAMMFGQNDIQGLPGQPGSVQRTRDFSDALSYAQYLLSQHEALGDDGQR